MIEEVIQVHDKYQFEIKQAYKFEKNKKITLYDIETYLFVPNSLDINRRTYNKNDFYNNLKTYIRFKTPSVLLGNICSGSDNPLEKLKKSILELSGQQDSEKLYNYEYQAKMFCCILKSAIRDYIINLSRKENIKNSGNLSNQYLFYMNEIISNFRQLKSCINVPPMDESIMSIYLFADEYISLLIESGTYNLLEIIKFCDFLDKNTLRNNLLLLIKNEIQYRKENNYPSIPGEKSENEELIFRKSVLKKFMENILFLNTRTEPEGKLFEQVIFGLASGIAMIFATVILMFSQQKYGNFTLPFFVALVVGYIFKDRIKEVLRIYLSGKVRNMLFDYKTNIQSAERNKIGFCEESFDFIKEAKVPAIIRKIRSSDHISNIERGWAGEKVILYRRHVKIFSAQFRQFYHNFVIDGINHIMRFNISRFLNKMDDPAKSLFVLNDDKEYQKINAERVYYINMIIKYSTENKFIYKHFKIVLNRDGIKRIDELATI